MNNFVVGYVAPEPQPGKWDGHAICRVGSWFIDTALHHFHREFGVAVHDVVAGPTFPPSATAIARIDIAQADRLWWFPPPGASTVIPAEPDDVIRPLAQKLALHIAGGSRGKAVRSDQDDVVVIGIALGDGYEAHDLDIARADTIVGGADRAGDAGEAGWGGRVSGGPLPRWLCFPA